MEPFLRKDGAAYTPVCTFNGPQHPIAFVGMVHIGLPAYYEEQQLRLDSYSKSGYAILVERLRHIKELPGEKVQPGSLELEMIQLQRNVVGNVLSAYGLVWQDRTLQVRPHWIDSDQPVEERRKWLVEEFADKERMRKTVESFRTAATRPVAEVAQHLFGFLATTSTREAINSHPAGARFIQGMMNQREEYLVQLVLSHVTTQPVAMCWGAGHIDGITRLLGENGYELVETEWIKAITLPSLSP